MAASFAAKKQKILQQLEIPDSEYKDASPKGSIDAGIRSLVDEVNAIDRFVTTSSCAGRLAVYLERSRKPVKAWETDGLVSGDPHLTAREILSTSQAGGKGGGEWLFVSHDPISLEDYGEPGALKTLLGLPLVECSHTSAELARSRIVHLKFEPMILHIIASSLESAQHALSAAMSAGFRESGIGGVLGSRNGPATPMIAVRSSGLAFDSIIAAQDEGGRIRYLVSEEYLRTLVKVANQRFRVNEERKERFRSGFLDRQKRHDAAAGGTDSSKAQDQSTDWEPAEARRERKRAEGLRERDRLQQEAAGYESEDSAAEIFGGLGGLPNPKKAPSH